MESDELLIGRVKQHDLDALADYLVACRKSLSAFIDRQLGAALRRKIEVDDILQEVSAEAVRSLAETEFDHRDPFGWLCQLAERRIIDAHRHYFAAQKRNALREVPLGSPGADSQHAGLIDVLAASFTTATQALSRKEREIHLMAALATLPQEQREALQLRYVEGLPSKDIAERLGKSDGSVRVMLTRALARLQQMLAGESPPR
jgi:RNA polymerase sigma-70 factor (ECF subfamily)